MEGSGEGLQGWGEELSRSQGWGGEEMGKEEALLIRVRSAPTVREDSWCCRDSFNHVLSTYCLLGPMVGDEDAVL